MSEQTPNCRSLVAVHRAFTDKKPEEIAEHLRQCETCRAEWRSLETLARAAKQAEPSKLSNDAKDQVRSRLLVGARAIAKQPLKPPPRNKIFLRVLGLAAIAAALALALVRPWALNTQASPPADAQATFRGEVQSDQTAHYAVLSTQPDEVVRLFDGSIKVRVHPLDPGERFRITTQDAEVEVRGTVLEVTATRGKLTNVQVVEGHVEVRPVGIAPILLSAGDQWIAPRQTPNSSAYGTAIAETAVNSAAVETQPEEPNPAQKPRKPKRIARQQTPTPPIATGSAGSLPLSSTASAGRPKPSPAELAFQEGWDALIGGRAAAASRYFSTVPLDDALGSDALFWRGVSLSRSGEASQAVSVLKRFLTLFPGSPHHGEALITLASLLNQQGNASAAIEKYRAARQSGTPRVRERADQALKALERGN